MFVELSPEQLRRVRAPHRSAQITRNYAVNYGDIVHDGDISCENTTVDWGIYFGSSKALVPKGVLIGYLRVRGRIVTIAYIMGGDVIYFATCVFSPSVPGDFTGFKRESQRSTAMARLFYNPASLYYDSAKFNARAAQLHTTYQAEFTKWSQRRFRSVSQDDVGRLLKAASGVDVNDPRTFNGVIEASDCLRLAAADTKKPQRFSMVAEQIKRQLILRFIDSMRVRGAGDPAEDSETAPFDSKMLQWE